MRVFVMRNRLPVLDRMLTLLVALSMALLVWLYARSRDQDTLDNVPIPVEVSLAPGQAEHYNLEINGGSQVLVSFTGPPSRIRDLQGALQRQEIHVAVTVTVPDERLHEGRYADTLHVESSDVPAPAGVTAMVVEGRNRVAVTLHRLVERRLPVRFEHARDEPPGPVELDPPTVLVRGPQEVLDRVRAIPTRPSELPTRPSGTGPNAAAVSRVPLVQELEGRPVRVLPPRVTVRVPAQARKVYELADVPVNFLCPVGFGLRPLYLDERAGRLNLRVIGPVQVEPPKVVAYVDLSRGRFTAGRNHEPLYIQLPRDFEFAEDPPRYAAFELKQADFAPSELGRKSPPTE